MPTVALDAWRQAWRPRSSLSVSEFGRKCVKLPHSARSPDYDPDQSYWLRDPLDALPDTSLDEIVLIGPPGSAKTTYFEVALANIIVENPGPTLVLNHTVPMTDVWFESRGKPALKACKPVAALWPTKLIKDKVDTVLFDHMPLWTGGANDSDTQSRSCRWVLGDEVWKWKQRIMRESRARLHDRWNAKCVFVSQGGDEKAGDAETELFAAYQAGTREVAHFTCPHCQTVQPWRMRPPKSEGEVAASTIAPRGFLLYDDCTDSNGVWDYDAAAASARYICENETCPSPIFVDDIQVRRQLSSSLSYVATNPKPSKKKRSFQYNALCVWWISWGTLAVEWIKANESKHKGDLGPLKTFKQKRLAEFWSDELTVPYGALRISGYLKTDYMNGEMWPGEHIRFLTIDKQKDHYWAMVAAWKSDGSSRILFESRVNTESALRDIQLRYKVMDGATFMDARYEPSEVYSVCAKFNWTAVMGEDRDLYTHYPKKGKPYERYFSKMEKVFSGINGHCWKINFGNKPLKDILSRLRAGQGAAWETPDDVSPEFTHQIDSEVLRDFVNPKTKEVTRRYVKIKHANHGWDLCVLQVLGACIANLIGYAPAPEKEKPMPEPDPHG